MRGKREETCVILPGDAESAAVAAVGGIRGDDRAQYRQVAALAGGASVDCLSVDSLMAEGRLQRTRDAYLTGRLRAEPVGRTGIAIRWVREYDVIADTPVCQCLNEMALVCPVHGDKRDPGFPYAAPES